MTIDQLLTLTAAGFSKAEILALANTQPQPQPQPSPQPSPQAYAIVEEGGVALFIDVREVRVIGRGHICAQAEGVGKAVGERHALRAAHITHEPLKRLREHTGNTLRADLLIV